MAVNLGDNFSYKGKKSNFDRDSFVSFKAMREYDENFIDDGHVSYCAENEKYYKFNRKNTFDSITGKWRMHSPSTDNELNVNSELPVSNKTLTAKFNDVENMNQQTKDIANQAVSEAAAAKEAVKNLEGFTNPDTASAELAKHVTQITENKTNNTRQDEEIQQLREDFVSLKDGIDNIIDGGTPDSKYGGARIIDCGRI